MPMPADRLQKAMSQTHPLKSILIVGAGPAGLAAAKTLLRGSATKYNVTIFESAQRVGGMWRAKPGETGDKCSPQMRTNLSRFTVSFSDLSWKTVENDPSMFPEAHRVGRYLQVYASKFIPDGSIALNRTVMEAKLLNTGNAADLARKWFISSLDNATGKEHTDTFDYLIIASGFFDKPSGLYSGSTPSDVPISGSVVIHSSKFRDIAQFNAKTSGNIVVVGGGISGSEAAATAAAQLIDARYKPKSGSETSWQGSKIFHVTARPFYCLPRYLPENAYDPTIQDFNLAPTFLPLDLVLYNLSRRGDGPITAANGQIPPDKAKKAHEFIQSLIGSDQRDIAQFQLAHKPDQMGFPAFTGVSDTYTEFVRSGVIVPVRGRATTIQRHTEKSALQVCVEEQDPWMLTEEGPTYIRDVVGIIEATGYQVHLDYLSPTVKEALQYDGANDRVPFLLSHGSVFNPNVPELAFVGFYEGPYWGVMEMQARLIACKWGEQESGSKGTLPQHFSEVENLQRAVREAVTNRATDVPQFWMADYVGLVDEFARAIGVKRADEGFGPQQGPSFPARYAGQEADRAEVVPIIREVQAILSDSHSKCKFAAAAAFRSMQGVWSLHRKIDSRNASSPGGTFTGTAHFHPRSPTSADYSGEYLYSEEGTFKMDTGYSFTTKKRYVYRYNDVRDSISAWFVLPDDVTVERMFHTLEFRVPDGKDKGWLASGTHCCEPDDYTSNYEFRFRGANLQNFGISYEVTGPSKDYTTDAWYTRPTVAFDTSMNSM